MEMIQDEVSSKIVETARKLLDVKHSGLITVRDILNEMQITNRVFYNRFHNMEEVLEILHEEEINKVREGIFKPYEEGEDFEAYCELIALKTLLLSNERQYYMSQFIFFFDSADNRNYEWWSSAIGEIVAKGKEMGYFRPDLDETAFGYGVWCFIRGFNADAVARNIPKNETIRMFRYCFHLILEGAKASS